MDPPLTMRHPTRQQEKERQRRAKQQRAQQDLERARCREERPIPRLLRLPSCSPPRPLWQEELVAQEERSRAALESSEARHARAQAERQRQTQERTRRVQAAPCTRRTWAP